MKKIALLSIIILISINTFSQTVDSITKRVSDEICDCVGDVKNKTELDKKLKKCSDNKINFIMNNSTKEENKVLLEENNLRIVIDNIELYVLENCENIRRIIKQDLDNETVKVSNVESNEPFPTNFIGKDIKNIKEMYGDIVAFNALVIKVHSAHNDKPYYQVKLEGGKKIWIASLVNSGYEKKGNIVRILGYVSEVKNDEFAKKYNKDDYHILAFCVIDMKTKQMAMMPGSEIQIKEWMNGKIPRKE